MRRNQKYSVGGGGRVEQSLEPGRQGDGEGGPGQDQEELGEKMVGGRKDCGRRAEEEEAATAEERGGGLFSTERIFQS